MNQPKVEAPLILALDLSSSPFALTPQPPSPLAMPPRRAVSPPISRQVDLAGSMASLELSFGDDPTAVVDPQPQAVKAGSRKRKGRVAADSVHFSQLNSDADEAEQTDVDGAEPTEAPVDVRARVTARVCFFLGLLLLGLELTYFLGLAPASVLALALSRAGFSDSPPSPWRNMFPATRRTL